MADIIETNYIGVMTGGWFALSGVTENDETSTVQTTISDLRGRALDQIDSTTYELTGDIVPQSGVEKEFRVTLTYNSDTEWFYFENPYPRLRSNNAAMSLFDFHKVMQRTLKVLDEEIAYLPSYPDFLLTNETESYIGDVKQAPKKVITYNTIKSEPGGIGGQPFTRPREIKKRVREQLFLDPIFRKDIDDPSEKLKYYRSEGQWFDNLVQFDLWTKTNYEAEEFIEWFEDILDRYRGMFKELGMQEMIYYRRVRDDTLLKWKNKYNLRSLIYYFRTEKLKVTEIHPIRRINIKTKMHYNYIYPKERFYSNQERILRKWLKSGG